MRSSSAMCAVVFDQPAPDSSATRVARVPVPDPGPGEVSLDVHYAGVNFKDVMARRGDPGYVRDWPFTPGLEVAGTVRSLGEGVAGPEMGTRVTAFTDSGGLAEVAVARSELCIPVPDELPLEIAAAAPGALTTAALLVTGFGHLQPGETLLVHSAAGGVGQAVARLARMSGAHLVLGSVGSADRVAAAEQHGYDRAFLRDAGLADTILEVTNGRGVDLVLDPQGTQQLDLDLEVAAPAGRIVLFGNAGGSTPDPLPPVGRLFAGNVAIAGFSLAAFAATAPARVAAALRLVLTHLSAGELDIELTGVEGLDRVAAAQQALADGHGGGKQVVRIHNE